MTLGFSTKWPDRMGELAGQPNYFTNKIIKSMWQNYGKITTDFVLNRTDLEVKKFEEIKPFEPLTINEQELLLPKLHTIRYDPHDRWKTGNKIHSVINNRTKNRFQFAPVIECVSVQKIEIRWFDEYPIVYVGNSDEDVMPFYWENPKDEEDGYGVEQMKSLALNDGFPSIQSFFDYFNEDLKEAWKIIHWTDLKY